MSRGETSLATTTLAHRLQAPFKAQVISTLRRDPDGGRATDNPKRGRMPMLWILPVLGNTEG